jgi:hypothetical protein
MFLRLVLYPHRSILRKLIAESGNFMKRSIPYPLLFITAILLDRIVTSSTQLGLNQSLRALSILLLSASLAMLLIKYFIRDWHRAQFIVLMMPVTLIVYRSAHSLLKTNFPPQATSLGIGLMLPLGLLYAILVSRKLWKHIQNPARLTSYFSLLSVILLGLQVGRLGEDSYHSFTSIDSSQGTTIPVTGNDFELEEGSLPDIYVIVLDGYARQDVLQNIYKHDNSEFIAGLERRGFYVANGSHSNYVQTPYTMASFWNLDYLPTWNSSYEYEKYLYKPIQNNRAFQALDQIGYTTVSLAGDMHYTEIKDADVYLSKFLPLNNFETYLLMDSPLEPLSNIFKLDIPVSSYETHRQRVLYQLDTLKKIPADISGPKIVYAHILAPHPPFVFNQNGDARELQIPFTLADGTEFQGGREEYLNGYREQVKFVNQEIMEVIDDILAKSKTPPVIVMMGDHGPASMFGWKFENPGCIWERTSNLYAILLPGHQNDGIVYPSITPVNTFRVIFNTYFGTELPLLEDNSYMMVWHEPTKKMDITNATDSLHGCTLSDE